MKRTAKAIAALFGLSLVLFGLSVAEDLKGGSDLKLDWMTNYEEALARAAKENKPVLMDFTGSDWCSGCIRLKREVFNTVEFKDFAEKNLVLLEIDFPKGKPQSAEQKAQNQRLADTMGIQGFPTVLMLNPKGKVLGEVEYSTDGPAAFIKTVQGILSAKSSQSGGIAPGNFDSLAMILLKENPLHFMP